MTPKLARRPLLVPDGLVTPDHEAIPAYVETFGPEVADVCAAAGFAPDPQQQHGLNILFGIRPDGIPASFAFGVISCRQNLKTGLLKQAVLGWLFVTEADLIVWSSHEMSTTRDALRDLETLIVNTPSLSKRLPATGNRGIYDGKTEERIELADGRRVIFKARTVTGGRGLTGRKVILDEGFALTASHVGSLIPTMAAVPSGQVVYASSAGKADSEILRDVRDRGRAGSSPRLGYLEWLAPREACGTPDCAHPKSGAVDCALDRPHLLIKANPTITTGRMTLETIESIRQELPPDEFMRECLGWWEEDDDRPWVLPKADYLGCLDPESSIGGTPRFALDLSPDRDWAAIGVSGLRADGLPHVELTSRGGVVDHRPGTDWIVPRLKQLREAFPSMTLAIAEGSGGKAFVKSIENLGIPVDVISSGDVVAACGFYFDQVTARLLRHRDQPEVRKALAAAERMYVADGAFKWSRLRSEEDITCLYAETLALWVTAGAPAPEFSMFGGADLDACDGCGEPAGDDAADHDYLCAACRAKPHDTEV